jgi:hypothetical protein
MTPSQRTSVKDELDAMANVWSIVEPLDFGARGRVLSWARDQVTSEALARLAADSPKLTDAQREQLEALSGTVRR